MSPPTVEFDPYSVRLELGASAAMGPSYTWDVYANSDKIGTITIPAGSVGTGTVKFNYNGEMWSNMSSEAIRVDWKLISGSSTAVYQIWLQGFSTTSGFVVTPSTQQRVGPFVGWTIGSTKSITITVGRN